MTDREIHDRAIAAEQVVAALSLTEHERELAVGTGYEAFKEIALSLARAEAARLTVSATLAAALRYSEVYFDLHDREGE